jgi:hypothetical protein
MVVQLMSLIALILLPVTGLWAQQIQEEKDLDNLEQRIRELQRMQADTLPLIVPGRGKSYGVPRYAMPWVAPADPEMARMPNMAIDDSIRFHLHIKKYDRYRQSPAGQPNDRYRREPFPER